VNVRSIELVTDYYYPIRQRTGDKMLLIP